MMEKMQKATHVVKRGERPPEDAPELPEEEEGPVIVDRGFVWHRFTPTARTDVSPFESDNGRSRNV